MAYENYLKPELMTLVVVLYALGALIKRTKQINDKFIPYILLAVSIVLSSLYEVGSNGFNVLSVFSGIQQGILCAAVAVLGNQLIKQASK